MTELIWNGKYKTTGDTERHAGPTRVVLPFQAVETVNESAADRGRTLELFQRGQLPDWRNRLIWGDTKVVLPSLLPEFGGKVNLVYIDPPFATETDFSVKTEIPETRTEVLKAPSVLEQKAYRDIWGNGLDSYLQWFSDTATLLRELLHDDGKLFVHCDWRVNSYIRVILDDIFGRESFRNEIIWRRAPNLGRQAAARQLGRVVDTIYVYSKKADSPFRGIVPITSQALALTTEGKPKGATWDEERKLYFTTAPRGDYTDQSIAKLRETGRIHESSKGKLFIKYFLRQGDDNKWYKDQPVDTLWDDPDVCPLRHCPKDESVNYPTQKPEGLLRRIITWSTRANDLVLDCFCGSGTSTVVAERLGRRWIAVDLGRFAIHTTRKRLLSVSGLKPFVVQNLGKYERQVWVGSTFDSTELQQARDAAYRSFILQLYGANDLSGHCWIHGRKGGRFVHVGSVDAPVNEQDVVAIAQEIRTVAGGQLGTTKLVVDVLGWDFSFGLTESARKTSLTSGVDVHLRRIPRDVLDKRAVERRDIKPSDFFELRMLDANASVERRCITIELADFIIPSEDLPSEIRKEIKHWSQWIDYWAIDWNYQDDTFHNEWQSFRSRPNEPLVLRASRDVSSAGSYMIMIKVIDILGNDTSKGITVVVP